ncbi:hypothetical protein G647_04296 [Cladophialophora carrionii CBS 160.54]|uniref:Uncharacterized protein n=1 Tax=Cladophialophora carrionii CBS 160.54 TaxID=1279043 RepID=V9DE37_9EURO|nr:uncharacterized protein G647_04296 [Cladophialophora carrionii CBS 160.54]ETI24926.1 hypothetical protein G647_04296 [Cladophialophora carrionii CBS 160.54]
MPTTDSVLYLEPSFQKRANMGRFMTTILSCLHNLLIQVPQNGYHNISRVVQPQIRSLSDSFVASSSVRPAAGMKKGDIELQSMKPKKMDTAPPRTEGQHQTVPTR